MYTPSEIENQQCDAIMSILAGSIDSLLRWGSESRTYGVKMQSRVGLMIVVDAFKHQGPVVIYPNEHPRHYDIELRDWDKQVLKTVECIPENPLVDNIDRLVEVTDNYFQDIDRWLDATPSTEKQLQQIMRMAKRSPAIAERVRIVPTKER